MDFRLAFLFLCKRTAKRSNNAMVVPLVRFLENGSGCRCLRCGDCGESLE